MRCPASSNPSTPSRNSRATWRTGPGFLKELHKAKVSLSLAEEAEWLGYFTEQQAKAHALQAQINKTDREIDALVYELYGLTEEEIAVVEGAG